MITRWQQPKNPWDPAPLHDIEVKALKSLNAGTASKEQQQLCLYTILVKLCRVDLLSFRPGGADGDRATLFAEGMRSVGTQIREILSRPMKPSGEPNNDDPHAETRRNPKPERPRGKPSKPTVPERDAPG